MFNHYLTTAWRSFLRFKLITAINVLGLALGIACCFVAIGIHTFFASADRHVPGSERAVMILQRYSDNVNNLNGPLMSFVSTAVPTSMRKELPDLPIAFVNGIGSIPVDIDGRREFVGTAVADIEYFDILNWPRTQLIEGNPLRTPNTAVIAEDVATQLFGDAPPIGRVLRLQGVLDVTIAGVLKSNSSSLPSHTNALMSLRGMVIARETARAMSAALTGRPFREQPLEVQWTSIAFGSALYAQLPADGSMTAAQLEELLQGLAERNGAPDTVQSEIRVATLTQAWIQELNVTKFNGSTKVSVVGLIVVLGVAALGVALANYINLSFAQASARTKETGLRRVIGASRVQLAAQIAVEIAMHLIISASIGFLLAVVVGQLLETYTGLPLLGNILTNFQFWTRVAATLLAMLGLFAACRLIGVLLVHPSHALHDGAAHTGGSTGAYILLSAQFVTTSILVVVLLVVGAQNNHSRQLAAQTSDDVLVTLDSAYRLGGAKFDVWKTELLRSPAVKGVVTTSSPPWQPGLRIHPLRTTGDRILNPNATAVSVGFEKVLDYRFVAGHTFTAEHSKSGTPESSETPAIVDETLARALGFKSAANAVGQAVRGAGMMSTQPPLRIVGVIADKPMRVQPIMDFVGTLYTPDGDGSGQPVIRLDKNRVSDGIKAIDEVWRNLAPKEDIGRRFADESFERAYEIYTLIGNVLVGVSLVAMVIAMMGGFGFALFVTTRRAREIGIRKSLGASPTQVLVLLLRDYSRPILVANVLGWPVGYTMIQRYLSTFEQPISISAWYFAASLVFTLTIAWIAVAGQVRRAARLNPATVLRYE
jgi:putative ABC transport system permease protein